MHWLYPAHLPFASYTLLVTTGLYPEQDHLLEEENASFQRLLPTVKSSKSLGLFPSRGSVLKVPTPLQWSVYLSDFKSDSDKAP